MPPSLVQHDIHGDGGVNSIPGLNSLSSESFGFGSQSKLDIGKGGIVEFSFGSRTPKKVMRVHYFLPTCWTISTPILFVMHGVKRDADKYFSKMIKKDLPQKFGFTLICPEFSKENFPSRAGYNSGNVFRKENTKRRNERTDWGFSALESIFDSYLSITGSRVDGYYLYGHSAGAQFVHRHLAFIGSGGTPLRVIRAVAANAGFYTLPTFEIPFPFGFGGTESVFREEDLRKYLQAPLTVVLGELDDDHHHKHLNRSEGAMQQGPHRLARGRHFYEAARPTAPRPSTRLAHSFPTAACIAAATRPPGPSRLSSPRQTFF